MGLPVAAGCDRAWTRTRISSGTASNCNAVVFGVPLDVVQQSGQPGQEVPLLVRHIVEYIEEHGRLDLEGLFLVNGNAERVEWLRQRYDSGEEVDLEKEADLASAVSLLRLFLQELPEPIIPAGMQSHILQLYQDYSSEEELARNMKYFLQQLPQVNYSLLRFLCRFLSSVASLQEESWSVGALAAVFGPDIFHLDTDVEDLKEQESVSRILAELLENQEEFFDSEDDDVSTTDYSSINEQITELLDDEKLEACEELPQDGEGEEGPPSTSESPQHSNTVLTLATEVNTLCLCCFRSIIERTIRAAVEQHFFDLKSSIDQEISKAMGYPYHPASSHHLQLSRIFPHNQWEDPVPAYKSWQDESDSGEAQLSPLAGRMVPSPHEEDAHPLMARRFLDFGHSQRFLQHSDPDATSPRRASFSSKESGLRNDSVSHQLTKKLQSLKKKIKQFEEQFENERNYKPSHGDRAANPKVLKWMTDLTKIRKQLKDAKHKEAELTPQTRPRSNTLPKSFGSTLAVHEVVEEAKGHRPTKEETLDLIQRRVKGKREEDGWPEDIKKMTKEELSCEKTVLQKNLLHYEGLHGRPVTREERLVVKPLYDRYRLVKQMLTRVSITPIIASPSSKRRNQTLQPIIEGETAHFCDEIEEEDEGEEEAIAEEVQSSGSEVIMALDPVCQPQTSSQRDRDSLVRPKMEETSGKLALDLRLSSSNASSMPELLEQLWKTRAEKKKLRKTIREFEDEFYQQNGRNVQKEDRLPMMDEYKEYKRIKAKLRLLEVLISKQDSSKSI
uniref:Family with sequence similarity 13 member B n=1 Tax=Oncorhynchus mykiss TaxID=8022 RepID=A0A8C7Q463_ONCMY